MCLSWLLVVQALISHSERSHATDYDGDGEEEEEEEVVVERQDEGDGTATPGPASELRHFLAIGREPHEKSHKEQPLHPEGDLFTFSPTRPQSPLFPAYRSAGEAPKQPEKQSKRVATTTSATIKRQQKKALKVGIGVVGCDCGGSAPPPPSSSDFPPL